MITKANPVYWDINDHISIFNEIKKYKIIHYKFPKGNDTLIWFNFQVKLPKEKQKKLYASSITKLKKSYLAWEAGASIDVWFSLRKDSDRYSKTKNKINTQNIITNQPIISEPEFRFSLKDVSELLNVKLEPILLILNKLNSVQNTVKSKETIIQNNLTEEDVRRIIRENIETLFGPIEPK